MELQVRGVSVELGDPYDEAVQSLNSRSISHGLVDSDTYAQGAKTAQQHQSHDGKGDTGSTKVCRTTKYMRGKTTHTSEHKQKHDVRNHLKRKVSQVYQSRLISAQY